MPLVPYIGVFTAGIMMPFHDDIVPFCAISCVSMRRMHADLD
jgi:hypothetical protein